MDLFVFTGPDIQYQTHAGSIVDPATSPYAFAAGAQCWNGTAIETFSAQGPTIDGRKKPDITGQDQMSGFTFGPDTTCATLDDGFTGTSASSPTVAGAAALVKAANPGFTVAQLESYLQSNAKDEGAVGLDNVYGASWSCPARLTHRPRSLPFHTTNRRS